MMQWKYIQGALADHGYNPGPIDGFPGPRTDTAIKLFKAEFGCGHTAEITVEFLLALVDNEEIHEMEWFATAMSMRGWEETEHKEDLQQWLDGLDPEDVPWCGAFVAKCLSYHFVPDNPLGARNWLKFGEVCDPQLGAVMVFHRGGVDGWKGHVGFYYGEDDECYHILGGNQQDSVSIARIRKTRLLGARWPEGVAQLAKQVYLGKNGTPVTTNEA